MHSCCVLCDNLWLETKTVGPQIGFFWMKADSFIALYLIQTGLFLDLFLSHVGRFSFVCYPAEQDNLVHPPFVFVVTRSSRTLRAFSADSF